MRIHRLALICLSLPALSWGVCTGEWVGGTFGDWDNGSNWSMSGCGDNFPGETTPGDKVELLDNNGASIVLNVDIEPLNSILMQPTSGLVNYIIENGGFDLEFTNSGSITVDMSGPNELGALIVMPTITFPDPGPSTMQWIGVDQTQLILFGGLDDSGGKHNISCIGSNFDVQTIANINGDFFLDGTLSINSSGTGNVDFENVVEIGGSPTLFKVSTLNISGGTLGMFVNVNRESSFSTDGARAELDQLVFQPGVGDILPEFQCSNAGDITVSGVNGSYVTVNTIIGSGGFFVNNLGSITTNGTGARFEMLGTSTTLIEGIYRIINLGPVTAGGEGSHFSINGPLLMNSGFVDIFNGNSVTSSGIGSQFQTHSFFIMRNGDLLIENEGQVIGAKGSIFSTAEFTFRDGICQILNTGEVSGGGFGAIFQADAYMQRGGTFTIHNSSNLEDETSIGALMQVTNTMDVSGGVLENNNYVLVGNTVNVNGSGIVKGTGVFSGIGSPLNVFINSGRVSPGNSPGTMSIVGNYRQTSLGTLEIHILNASGPGPNGYSQLELTGAATLGGTVQFVLDEGAQVNCNDTFVFLTADSITGEFANLSDNFPENFSPCLIYEDQAVRMILRCEDPCPCPCPCLCDYIGNFTQTLFGSITETNNFFIKRQLQRVQERIMKPKESTKGNVYFGPIGSVGTSEQACNQVGFDYWSAGVVAGADYAFEQGGVGGLVLYEDIESDNEECGWGSFRTQRAHASVYGSYVPEQVKEVSIDLMVGGGYDWYRIERNSKRGSPNGFEFDTMISFEYMYTQGNYHVVPMVNLQYAYLKVDDYREDCGGICFDDQRAKSLSTVLGVWGDYTWKPVTLQANLGWQREYLNNDRTLSFSGGCLNLEGAQRNNLLAGLNVLWQIREVWSVEASYDLIWNNQFDRNGFYLGVNRSF